MTSQIMQSSNHQLINFSIISSYCIGIALNHFNSYLNHINSCTQLICMRYVNSVILYTSEKVLEQCMSAVILFIINMKPISKDKSNNYN
jgi:hypothetical protein